ncbi:MAG: cation-translocating P-type ATPase [Chitinophagaceae bacterium]|nr:cation-translocating P-type ATPase [Chitinophagaceae bacterium]
MNWHLLSVNEVLNVTGSNANGITDMVAQTRLQEYGPNELQQAKKRSPFMMFVRQFMDVMILVLVAAALISGLIGDVKDTIVIIAIVILNAVIGFIQEYRAEKAMESLKKMAAPFANVIRNKQFESIPASQLVPGDVVLLEAGNMVPADLRIIETNSLKIDEASLTGESHNIEKIIYELQGEDFSIGDRVNLAFKGTYVTYGRGKGVVVATGMNTELGQIARMLQEKESATPLQVRMTDFSKKLSVFILLLCGLLFLVGYLRGEDWLKMLLTALSLAVAAIPEALPAVITIALAFGAKRLVQNNALARRLHAVETLGSVTYICTDKTGTLTQNKMTVIETWEPSSSSFKINNSHTLLTGMMLNHDVKENSNAFAGDPTEIALVEYGIKNGMDISTVAEMYPRVAEIPFDSDRKLMTTIHNAGNKYLLITKGATEAILQRSIETTDGIINEANNMAAKGMRVIAFGMKWIDQLPKEFNADAIETNLHCIGLTAMIDPPRPEVSAAIAECKTAGIQPVMITGDHPITAEVIAREIGILHRKDDKIITGSELNKMSDESFAEEVEHIRVYARVSPEQKLDIVKALQKKNHFVSMTGDGVNDAPALKKANIGVAMGITGTDVSKEAAHMILLDDNFATIVKAVREGRRIFDNIRKFIKYIMTGNSAEIWSIMLAPLLGLPIPLLPIHILWINLVTDGFPALALAVEPEEKQIMQRPPRHPKESIFSGGMGYHIIWVGFLIGLLTLGTQAFEIYTGNSHWQTIVFTVLCLAQMWHVLAIRSERESLFAQGIFSNKLLLGAVLLTFILQMCTIYVPVLNTFFNTQPLTWDELLLAIGVSSIVFIAVEIEKWWKRKNR